MILDRFFKKRRAKDAEYNRQLVSALDEFIQQVYWGEDLAPQESRRNLEQGLVEIIHSNGAHVANGLLVTDNGYYLTGKHCTQESQPHPHELNRLMVRLYNGETYPLKGTCVRSARKNGPNSILASDEDLALVKADIPGDFRVRKYKFCLNPPTKLTPVALMARRAGKLTPKYGYINLDYNHRNNTNAIARGENDSFLLINSLPLDIKVEGGDSGGVIVDPDGGIFGFAVAGIHYSSSAARLMRALELIGFYRARIQERI